LIDFNEMMSAEGIRVNSKIYIGNINDNNGKNMKMTMLMLVMV